MTERRVKNGLWGRVTGPDADPFNKERAERNRKIMENPQFREACQNAGIEEIPVQCFQQSGSARRT